MCLIQVAAGERLAVVDPLAVGDVTPFWEAVAAEGHETVVHAGREEFCFSLAATGAPAESVVRRANRRRIGRLRISGRLRFAAQQVAGPVAAEGRNADRLAPPAVERHQIDYALDDVRYLPALRDRLREQLESLGRLPWMETEMAAWQDDVENSRTRERWRRVSGIGGLSARSLAIVRELWRWREGEAERRDSPVRRVLRDDLIVELARRQTADLKRIRAVRGLERGDLQRLLPQLAERIEAALALPDDQIPHSNAASCRSS